MLLQLLPAATLGTVKGGKTVKFVALLAEAVWLATDVNCLGLGMCIADLAPQVKAFESGQVSVTARVLALDRKLGRIRGFAKGLDNPSNCTKGTRRHW